MISIIAISLIVIFIIISAILHFDSSIAIVIGFGFLIGAAVTLALGNSNVADQLAIYSFYSLATGVAITLIEHFELVPKGRLNSITSNINVSRVISKNWLPYLLYSLLSLAILGALLKPGYILTLDGIFTPKLNFNLQLFGLNENVSSSTSAAPLWLLLQFSSKVIPAWILQKAVFFFAFFLAGLGAHRLFYPRGVGRYFAGIFYAITPFIYVRFLAGQWGVLWAYALMPFAVKSLVDLLNHPDAKGLTKLAILSSLVGLVQIQGFMLLLLTFVIVFLIFMIQNRGRIKTALEACKYLALSGGLFTALNLYWLIPTFLYRNSILGQITPADEILFAPQTTGGRIMFDITAMYGFWRGGYIYVKDILSLWWILFIFIFFLSVFGFISGIAPSNRSERDESKYDNTDRAVFNTKLRWLSLSFGIIWIISLFLAAGAAAPQSTQVFGWIWDHFPLLRAFRDSQKFVALTCLAYAFLGGLGVAEFARALSRVRNKIPRIGLTALIVVALLTPLAYSFTIFGFHGQLGTTDYPQDWYKADSYLNQDQSDFNVLVLPWHAYMDFAWLPNQDKRLANPAQQFFDKPVIQGDNLEMPGVYTENSNPISKYVEFLLANQKGINNLGALLAPLNVKYVIVLHEADFASYDFVFHQADLKTTLDLKGLTILENQHSLSRVYGINDVVHIQTLNDYLKLSQQQDVMEHIYVLGQGPDSSQGSSEMQPVAAVEKSPIDYRVESASQKYLVFTVPQGVDTEHWKSNGQDAVLKNLGFMPVFETRGAADIVYTPFYIVYLPVYILSGLTLSGIAVFQTIRKARKKR